MVMNQIKYLGIADSIKAKKMAFPVRKKFKRFYCDYSALDDNYKSMAENEAAGLNFEELSKKLFTTFFPDLKDD
jgi:myosin heavy subunit